jgi:Transposase DDE domain
MVADIPRHCDRGTKCNAQGYKNSWSGFKLHVDTADCGVPLAAMLSSASVHDSRCAIPLSRMTEQRVHAYLYDVQDAAYCSEVLRSDSLLRGRVALTDHNPRRGDKVEFAPHEAQRYKVRSAAERTNARLKEEFGANNVMVRGADKVMCHLMFGLLVLSADQLMRLRQ